MLRTGSLDGFSRFCFSYLCYRRTCVLKI
jgi:hypothetical protein